MGNKCSCLNMGFWNKSPGQYDLPDPNPRPRNPPPISDTNVNKGRKDFGAHENSHRNLPPLPGTSKKRARALYNFAAINEDDLSFNKGDVLEVDDSVPQGTDWWLATHVRSKKRGYIPSNYVAVDDKSTSQETDDSSPQAQDWWFEIDRPESNKMLMLPGNPKGSFLIRASSDTSSYAISVRDVDERNGEPCIRHYKIRKMEGNKGVYINGKNRFPNLFDLISHYKKSASGLCCKLTKPCPRIRPTVQFRALEISRHQIRLSSKIGSGCFGDVWRGTLRKVVDVAVKTLRPGTMSSEAFLNEAKIMHRLTHNKLVQILAVVSVEEPFYIITEYMVNGALLDCLQSGKGKKFKFSTIINMNTQIAEGMAYLESKNFVHRDLRAANVLVGENFNVKVADFGLARILENEIYLGDNNTKFPIKWTAPEAALHKKFTVKSDVWSYGVLLYEIITFGRVPYPGMSGPESLKEVEAGYRMEKPTNLSLNIPDSYYDMMLKCWTREPERRPTFVSLHDFFEEYFISTERNYAETDKF